MGLRFRTLLILFLCSLKFLLRYSHSIPAACFHALSTPTKNYTEGTQQTQNKGWNSCNHTNAIGLNFDYGLAQFITQVLKPSSALELSCGYGLYLDWLVRFGSVKTAYGIEASNTQSILFSKSATIDESVLAQLEVKPELINLRIFDGSSQSRHCVAELGSFDVVFSLGAMNHMHRSFDSVVADFLADATRGFLVFTAAGPRHGRFDYQSYTLNSSIESANNVADSLGRSRDEWQEEFESRGMLYLKRTTQALVENCFNKHHKKGNLMVFAGRHAPMGHALDSELTVDVQLDRAFNDLIVDQQRLIATSRSSKRDHTGAEYLSSVTINGDQVRWCANLKAGELQTWPKLVAEQAHCFRLSSTGSCLL